MRLQAGSSVIISNVTATADPTAPVPVYSAISSISSAASAPSAAAVSPTAPTSSFSATAAVGDNFALHSSAITFITTAASTSTAAPVTAFYTTSTSPAPSSRTRRLSSSAQPPRFSSYFSLWQKLSATSPPHSAASSSATTSSASVTYTTFPNFSFTNPTKSSSSSTLSSFQQSQISQLSQISSLTLSSSANSQHQQQPLSQKPAASPAQPSCSSSTGSHSLLKNYSYPPATHSDPNPSHLHQHHYHPLVLPHLTYPSAATDQDPCQGTPLAGESGCAFAAAASNPGAIDGHRCRRRPSTINQLEQNKFDRIYIRTNYSDNINSGDTSYSNFDKSYHNNNNCTATTVKNRTSRSGDSSSNRYSNSNINSQRYHCHSYNTDSQRYRRRRNNRNTGTPYNNRDIRLSNHDSNFLYTAKDTADIRTGGRRDSTSTTLNQCTKFSQSHQQNNTNSSSRSSSSSSNLRLALIWWNCLSIALFLMALGLCSAQSSTRRTSSYPTQRPGPYSPSTSSRRVTSPGRPISGQRRSGSASPRPLGRAVAKSTATSERNRVLAAWAERKRLKLSQCKILDENSIDALCHKRWRPGERSSTARPAYSTSGNALVTELRDTYLFPACMETGETSLYNFFMLSKVLTDSNLVNPSLLKHLDTSVLNCLSPDANYDQCRDCYKKLIERIKYVVNLYQLFLNEVLTQFDCKTENDLTVYSAITNCTQCKLWYKRWLLITIKNVWNNRPCVEWCHLAELACPHLLPSRKFEYAGLPSFRCTDVTIPLLPLANSTYSTSDISKCLHPCETWTSEVYKYPFFEKYCQNHRPRRKEYIKKKRKQQSGAKGGSADSGAKTSGSSTSAASAPKWRRKISQRSSPYFSLMGLVTLCCAVNVSLWTFLTRFRTMAFS